VPAVTDACVGELNMACVEECPVDCIYQGDQMVYIHPTECIMCGACEVACPVGAIFDINLMPPGKEHFPAVNSEYFYAMNHAHSGMPGGASLLGPSGVDHPAVSGATATATYAPTASSVDMDVAVYHEMLAEGRDERVARGRAKAAAARAARGLARRYPATATPSDAAAQGPSVPISHITVEASGHYDSAVYQRLLAQGATETVARAKAKAHFIREQKRRIAEGG
jgi:NAD-dependent dihydropyrimidine dehydrogenase PreA subunit